VAPALCIHLLGAPHLEIGGSPAPPPRGRKAWALLAFLLLTDAPIGRRRLAELLFAEADDPLGTLRWNLAQLRRALGVGVELGGDPVRVTLPPGAELDVRVLTSGTWAQASSVRGIGLELLAGIDVPSSAAFETWLLTERHRLAHLGATVLREAATAHLAAGRAEEAATAAGRLVEFDEFDEDAQALLISALVAAGGRDQAARYRDSVVERFRRELGIEPGTALIAAAEAAVPAAFDVPAVLGAPAVESLLAAGEAAIGAGVIDAGIDILSRATASARELGAPELEARVAASLGTALIHGGRGLDSRGIAALHAALDLAEKAGDAELIATSARELGYADMKRGRYERAETWLARAVDVAPTDATRSAALAVRGVVASDRGQTATAIAWLSDAAEVARELDRPRQEAWALAFLGRAHVLREEAGPARVALERAIEVTRGAGWMTFASLPLSLLAEAEMLAGNLEAASDGFERAFALGCQVGDPCWEGIAARGIGLGHAAAGRVEDAIRWLDDARTRCMRVADAYLWVHAHCLDALCGVAVEHRVDGADAWINSLEAVAARTGMHELVARAYLHRARLGDRRALEAARVFVDRLDNPALGRLLAAAGAVASGAATAA
jgi:DNA-binding SARP family transcriptional activator